MSGSKAPPQIEPGVVRGPLLTGSQVPRCSASLPGGGAVEAACGPPSIQHALYSSRVAQNRPPWHPHFQTPVTPKAPESFKEVAFWSTSGLAVPIQQASSRRGDRCRQSQAGGWAAAGLGLDGMAELRVSKLPGRTREDKGSRLTLSPAVPPGWMHSIQSPGGQITQTPMSVARQLRAACGMRGACQPWWWCRISTAPGLRGSPLKEASIKAGSLRIRGIVGEKGRSRKPCPLPFTTPFPRSPAGSWALEAVTSDLPGRRGHFYTPLTAGSNGFTFSGKYLAVLKKFPLSDLEIPLIKGYPEETPRIHIGICVQGYLWLFITTHQWKPPPGSTGRNQ